MGQVVIEWHIRITLISALIRTTCDGRRSYVRKASMSAPLYILGIGSRTRRRLPMSSEVYAAATFSVCERGAGAGGGGGGGGGGREGCGGCQCYPGSN